MKFCSKCGARLRPDAIFCPNCGKKVDRPVQKRIFIVTHEFWLGFYLTLLGLLGLSVSVWLDKNLVISETLNMISEPLSFIITFLIGIMCYATLPGICLLIGALIRGFTHCTNGFRILIIAGSLFILVPALVFGNLFFLDNLGILPVLIGFVALILMLVSGSMAVHNKMTNSEYRLVIASRVPSWRLYLSLTVAVVTIVATLLNKEGLSIFYIAVMASILELFSNQHRLQEDKKTGMVNGTLLIAYLLELIYTLILPSNNQPIVIAIEALIAIDLFAYIDTMIESRFIREGV